MHNKPATAIGAGSWSNQQHAIIVLLHGLKALCSALLYTFTSARYCADVPAEGT